MRSLVTRLLKLAENDCLIMRNIKTFIFFLFLVFLARTGGIQSAGEIHDEEEQEELMERENQEIQEEFRPESGGRERRGLYGGLLVGDVCPDQCLCLSEIQVLSLLQS